MHPGNLWGGGGTIHSATVGAGGGTSGSFTTGQIVTVFVTTDTAVSRVSVSNASGVEEGFANTFTTSGGLRIWTISFAAPTVTSTHNFTVNGTDSAGRASASPRTVQVIVQ